MVPFDQLVHGLANEVTLPGHADLISGMLNAVGDNDKGRFGKDFLQIWGTSFKSQLWYMLRKYSVAMGVEIFSWKGNLTI